MSNDPSNSDAPFGEINLPKKKQSPFTPASTPKAEAKTAAAAASVRSNLMEPDEDFAAPSVQRLKTPEQVANEPLGDLPDIDDFAAPPIRSALPAPGGEIPQLVLKAIFGVSEEMDRNEILRRARALPNIKSVNLVGRPESEAFAVLQKSIRALGQGDEPLTLRVGGSDIDFIKEEGVTLAVLTNGGYAAGIRETLIIVARELARLV